MQEKSGVGLTLRALMRCARGSKTQPRSCRSGANCIANMHKRQFFRDSGQRENFLFGVDDHSLSCLDLEWNDFFLKAASAQFKNFKCALAHVSLADVVEDEYSV